MSLSIQTCEACGKLNYPRREVCRRCLSDALVDGPVEGTGTVLATSLLHVSGRDYFKQRLPWRIGSVLLEVDVVLIVHMAGDNWKIGDRVEVRIETIDEVEAFVGHRPGRAGTASI